MHVGLIPALGLSWAAVALAFASPAVNAPPLKLVATLSGANEAPTKGDPDGSGVATLMFRPEANEVCYEFQTNGLDQPTEAHIHTGASGSDGAVVLTLTKSLGKEQKGCAKADGKVLEKIAQNPAAYYVNVHSKEFTKGAIRGQLQAEGVKADTGSMGINKPGGPDSIKPYTKDKADTMGINKPGGPDTTKMPKRETIPPPSTPPPPSNQPQ